MSLSKRYTPPVGKPFKVNVPPVGVGSAGMVVVGPLRCCPVTAKVLLSGVLGEISEMSGVETDRLRFFRLDEEKFFRRFPGPVATFLRSRAGELGTGGTLSSLSYEVTFVRAGVTGDSLGTVSAGLDSENGDDICRLIAWLVAEAGA